MNKSILVIDTPYSCSNCPINFWNNCGVLEHKSKTSGHIENPSYERLQNCPLKPLPEKLSPTGHPDDDCGDVYVDGYNQCIDDIKEEI